MVKDIHAGSNSNPKPHIFLDDGRLVFSANDGILGEVLWVTDGTDTGTEVFHTFEGNSFTIPATNVFFPIIIDVE